MKPGVSVVTPFHAQRKANGMLERAAASVRKQTVPVHHILAEDIHHLGAAITRAHGLALVDTEWTAFLDSDDELDPDHIEQLLVCAKETGADYVYPWFRVVGGTDPFPMFYGKPFDPAAPNSTTITILVRTELAQQVGFARDPNVQVSGEDFQFTLGCITAGAKIVHLPRISWTWFHHNGNTSGISSRGDAKR
ncbi:glycosyltransferase family 2 protein [Streptomyces sp. NBC_01352]|uniref:glycosyltransferase family 2 protein n=1 Tax=Streptomyces sp. NBC_01352 TaxID=2903834 RepID=UPI002E360687|nr:glycosyltransferase family A protein [Streptomyces sp. NBC_01352]